MQNVMNVSYDTKIPNNVNLSSDRRVLKALEKWHPGYIDWWTRLIPQQFQDAEVYLRTAIGVETGGWAKFDYVKMPEYRWGILLAPQVEDRRIPCGEHAGEMAWQEVPGEYRAMLRRLIVIQGDTEPGSTAALGRWPQLPCLGAGAARRQPPAGHLAPQGGADSEQPGGPTQRLVLRLQGGGAWAADAVAAGADGEPAQPLAATPLRRSGPVDSAPAV